MRMLPLCIGDDENKEDLFVDTGRNTVCRKLLHWITITSSQGFVIIPINRYETLRLESEMCHFTTRKLRRTYTSTTEKDREDKTISLNAALEHEAPSMEPCLEVTGSSLFRVCGGLFHSLTLFAYWGKPAIAVGDSNPAVISITVLATI